MYPSERIQKLIDHVNRDDELDAGKRRHICSALLYFKNQLSSDLDRRDDTAKIKASWLQFQKLMHGSKLFDRFKNDNLFWSGIESSLGFEISVKKDDSPPITKRPISSEDFFLDIASNASRQLDESPEKKLILFGLWCLALEARIAKPYRTQSRIELIYRYIHPRLKAKGLLKPYESNVEVQNMIKYFIKGSIY